MSNSQAEQLSTETQIQIFGHCTTWVASTTTLEWSCRLVGQGYADAQRKLAYFFRCGNDPFATDLARAYALYSLAGYQGFKEDVASKMSPIEATEAERLLAEWESNPPDCEEIGVPIGN